MSNERHVDTVEFEIVDRATCYIVSADGIVKTENSEVPGVLTCVRLYAEGEWVTEYTRGETIDRDDLAAIRRAAGAAGIELAERGCSFGVPGDD